MTKKSLAEAYILGITFGLFGAHHFYLGRRFFGILYACTLGLFGIGYLYDLVRMRTLVRHVNQHGPDGKMLSDCYLLCAFGGWFGVHYFYLGKKRDGCFYAFTLGILGAGVVVDMLRMKSLFEAGTDPTSERRMNKTIAYTMCLSPLGLLGIHELYLKRKTFFIYPAFIIEIGFITFLVFMGNDSESHNKGDTSISNITLSIPIAGLCLLVCRWPFVLSRLSVIYERALSNEADKYVNVEDGYLWWFPLGMFGFHYLYLGKARWILLYMLTFGCLGIGWLIDGFRMPKLVKECNKKVMEGSISDVSIEEHRVVRPETSNSHGDGVRANNAQKIRSPRVFYSESSGTVLSRKPIPEDRVCADHTSASNAGKRPTTRYGHHGGHPATHFVHYGPTRVYKENDNVDDPDSKSIPGVRLATNRDRHGAMRSDHVAASDSGSIPGGRIPTNRDRYSAIKASNVAASDSESIHGMRLATNRGGAIRSDYVAASDIGSIPEGRILTNRDNVGARTADNVATSDSGSIPGTRLATNRDRYGLITADTVAASDMGSIPGVRLPTNRDRYDPRMEFGSDDYE